MSWHFSLELGVAYWRAVFSGGIPSALSSSTGTDGISCSFDKKTGVLGLSRYGTTYEPSMASHGEAVLTWFREGFPARRIPRRLEAATRRMISGRKCGEWWQKSLPGTSLPRTPKDARLTAQPTTSRRWVTKPAALPCPRRTWVQTTYGPDIGYVHTPTATANYAAPSMQKWPGCRAFVQAFGQPTPENHEWLMGWPIGWSDLKPLETGRFQSWLRRHGG